MRNQSIKKKSDKPPHKAIIGHYDCHDHRIRVQDLSSDTENVSADKVIYYVSFTI